jgi:hypothetical protein
MINKIPLKITNLVIVQDLLIMNKVKRNRMKKGEHLIKQKIINSTVDFLVIKNADVVMVTVGLQMDVNVLLAKN